MKVSSGHAGSFRVPRGVCRTWVRFAPAGENVSFCCAMLRRVARGGGNVPRRHGDTEEGAGWGLRFWRVGSFCISESMARVGVVWRALEQVGATGACLHSPSARNDGKGRWGQLGKAWHPEEDDVGLRARMGPLPRGRVVRGRDEDLGKNLVFGRILSVFWFGARCALRITGAHRGGVRFRRDNGLGAKQNYCAANRSAWG
jgi:hypothetical protein